LYLYLNTFKVFDPKPAQEVMVAGVVKQMGYAMLKGKQKEAR